MSNIIVIEGTDTPSAYLSRGNRRVVARTPLIERMITQGFVRVVENHGPAPEPVITPAQTEAFQTLVEEGVVTVPDAAPSADNTVPAGNASKAVWRAFLEANGVEVDPAWTRDEMVAAWNADTEE